MNRYHWLAALDAYIVFASAEAYSRWNHGPLWVLAFSIASFVIFFAYGLYNIQESKK
jgi:hypothetical protein